MDSIPAGLQWYWKADFFRELTDEAIAEHMKYAAQLPTMHSTMHLYPVNGAAHKIGKDDTAWSYRDVVWSQVIVGVDPDPTNKDKIVEWARAYWERTPFVRRGRRLRQLHDGRRRSEHSRHISRELRQAGSGQTKIRPAKFLQRKPEHPACRRIRCSMT